MSIPGENMRRTTSAVPAEALAALDAEDFDAIVLASLGPETDPAVWDALTDPLVIARTKVTLAAFHTDVEGQLSVASSGARARASGGGKQAYFDAMGEQAEWRRKALGFRLLVQRRIAFVKTRIPRPVNGRAGSGEVRRRQREALEALTRAVAAHRDRVTSGDGGEDDDDDLWDHLETIAVPDGNGGEQTLAAWLAWLDETREEDE